MQQSLYTFCEGPSNENNVLDSFFMSESSFGIEGIKLDFHVQSDIQLLNIPNELLMQGSYLFIYLFIKSFSCSVLIYSNIY